MSEDLRDKAFKDYNNGMKYKDIAEKYDVSFVDCQVKLTHFFI
ncbi:hypothetical protein [Acetobacterium bakii]|nr:hypothetical protein [Acetobacterium bakii]